MPLKNRFLTFSFPIFFLLPCSGLAQLYDTVSIFKAPVQLDSVLIRSGFNIKAFIIRVQNDTTFYKAFKSLHLVPYAAENFDTAFDKQGQVVATLHNNTKQSVTPAHCRRTSILKQTSTGNFFDKKGKNNYYTAELFSSLFFSDNPVCNENDIVSGSLEAHGKGQMEKNKYELKQLIFNPGSKVKGVPFMGDRAAIFDEGESYKYNFKVTREMYNGIECYVFRIAPKPEYEDKVVYSELNTWFRRSDYCILARDYALSFKTLVYDFDVKMKVRTTQSEGKLYPSYISYDGNWHVFTKKREHMKVLMTLDF